MQVETRNKTKSNNNFSTMKRKFTNVFLLVAVAIAALTAFVSCKDYEDDLRTESEIRNDELAKNFKDQLETLKGELDQAVQDLTNQLNAINSCDCDTAALKQGIYNRIAELYQLKGNYVTKEELNQLINEYLKTDAAWNDLTQQIANVVNKAITETNIINNLWDAFEEYNYLDNYITNITNLIDLDTLKYYVMQSALEDFVTKDELANYTTNAQLEDKLKEYYTQAEVDALVNGVKESLKNYATKEELADSVAKVNLAVKALSDEMANIKATAEEALTTARNAAEAAQAAADKAAAAQDTAVDAKRLAEAAKALAELLEPRVKTLEDAVADLPTIRTDILNLKGRVVEVADTARAAYQNAELALNKVDTLRSKFEEAIAELKKRDVELSDTMKMFFDSINNRCTILHDSIEAVRDEAYELFNEAMNEFKRVENQLNYRIDSLAIDTRERIGNAAGLIDGLAERVEKVEERLSTAEGLIKLNELKIDTLKNRMDDAENAIDGLTERMDSIENRVGALEEKFNILKGRVDELYGRVDDLSDRLNKLITSIIIQGTHNPIFGGFATPWGVESFILATYYGQHPRTDEFPTAITDYYDFPSDWNEGLVYKDEIYLDEQDIEVFTEANGSNEFYTGREDSYMFIDGVGNAGTVYLTVNSAKQQDFSGTKFQLVNTKDQEGPVKLEALEKETDWVKYFGYHTRGANDNGLYRAQATISEDFAKAAPKINLNVDDVKDMLSNIKENIKTPTKIDMTKVLSNVYKAATSNVLPAYGIKAPWQDSEGEHAVYSSYNLAATAVHPLSFSFLKDVNPELPSAIPGVTQLENAIGKFIDNINIDIPTFNIDNLTAPVIQEIKLAELSDSLLAKFEMKMRFDTIINVTIDETLTPELNPIIITSEDIKFHDIEVKIPTDTLKIDQFPVNVTLPEMKIDPITVHAFGSKGQDTTYVIEPVIQVTKEFPVMVQVPDIYTAEIVKTIHPEIDMFVINPSVKPYEIHISKDIPIFVWATVDMRENVKMFYNEVQQPLANVNKMIADINKYLDNVNTALAELDKVNSLGQQIVDGKEKIKDTINYYIETVVNKMLPYLTPGIYLQPIMIAQGTNDFMRLSGSKRHPSKVRGTTMNLIPSTVNAELLSPAYRKWVAVTDVYKKNHRGPHAKGGDTECINVRKAANKGQMNKVLKGNVYSLSVDLQPGYIYEISYQAMDYSGIVRAKKYYVQAQ